MELADLASTNKLGQGVPMTAADGGTTYSADLPVGSYVVLVTGSDDIIYNPMLVGVYYSLAGSGDDNKGVIADTVSATDSGHCSHRMDM